MARIRGGFGPPPVHVPGVLRVPFPHLRRRTPLPRGGARVAQTQPIRFRVRERHDRRQHCANACLRDPRRHPLRGHGHPAARGQREAAQAAGGHRRPPDPLAHHEALQLLRLPQVRPVPGLQERPHQAVLPGLPDQRRRLHPEPVEPRHPHLPHQRCAGGLGDHLRRDRSHHRHRGPHQARRAAPDRRQVPPHLRRRPRRRRHRQDAARPRGRRPPGHRHRGAPELPLRRDARRPATPSPSSTRSRPWPTAGSTAGSSSSTARSRTSTSRTTRT